MLKAILFSALLGAACASSYLSYDDIDHSNLGLVDVDDVRPHYMIPHVQSHIPVEFGEHDRQDLILEDEIGKPLEQISVDAFPKYPSHSGSRMKHGNYKGSDGSSEIKQKKHSYESTKVSQEEIEVKSVNNQYGSRIPHQHHKPSGYDQPKHVSSKGIYRKKLPEQKKENEHPGDYSHSIGEKNEPKESGKKHYNHHQPEPVQRHIEPDFKAPPMKYDHHAPIQQKTYESEEHPKHIGHKGAYDDHSTYKMIPKHKEISYQKPQTHGIYREGPKKYPSSYHSPRPKTHHSVAPIRNYNHGIKGHGSYTGPQIHKDSGYKNHGSISEHHGIKTGHGGPGFSGYNPGHYNQPKHSSIKSYQHPTHSSGHMTYHRGIGGGIPNGHNTGYEQMHRGYGVPRSNSGYHGIKGPEYSSPMKHYSSSPSYHHNIHNIKKPEHYPKSIKTSGIMHHSLRGNIAPSYSRPVIPSEPKVYKVPLMRTEHQSKKGYSPPILTQQKHIDDDYKPKSGIGESSYHGEKSYHKAPEPQKHHYQPEHHPKPSYSGSKSHHAPKEYHGIGENNPKSSYPHSHGGPPAHQPTYQKSHSVKGGVNAYKPESSSEGSKKYLPITASHGNNYKTKSAGSPIEQKKYEPSKIEQKDIAYEANLGGHGSPSGIASGSGYGSSDSSHKYKPKKIEQKDIGYEDLLGGHGSQNPGYGSSGSSSSHGSPSSHDVYSSDEKYEMSKPMPYEFKYEVKDDEHGADQYREEKMDDNGYLTGRYGYKDPHGLYRQVEYEASKAGFKVSSIKTNEPGTANEDPADVHFEVEKNSQSHY